MNAGVGDKRKHQVRSEASLEAEAILTKVYKALETKGYDPINQIVGYILSGDPTYITSYQQARILIRRLERDEIVEELVRNYIAVRVEE